MVTAEADAVRDRVQAGHRHVALRARLGRRGVAHRDECVDELGRRAAQQHVGAAARVDAVLGVDRRGPHEPRGRGAVDQRQWVVRVDDVGAARAELAGEPRHQGRIDPAALRHPADLDARLGELLRHRAVGLGRERDHTHPVTAHPLADREIERDPLLTADAVAREHVDDRPHARSVSTLCG